MIGPNAAEVTVPVSVVTSTLTYMPARSAVSSSDEVASSMGAYVPSADLQESHW